MFAHNEMNVSAKVENGLICNQKTCMDCSRVNSEDISKHLTPLAYTMVDRRDTTKQKPLMRSIAVASILNAGTSIDMLTASGISKSSISSHQVIHPVEPKESHVYAKWQNKNKELATADKDASVFGKLGVLAVSSPNNTLKIPKMNALTVPAKFLAQYGAVLVPLVKPVDIEPSTHDSLSNLYLIEYDFHEDYVQDYALKQEGGGGIFIETHPFPQLFTPLSPTCSGGLILGRKNDGYYSFIAIEIPFGYTLKIKSNVIHGDSFFVGPYAIALTETDLADSVLFRQNNANRDIINIHQKPVKPPRTPFLSEYELYLSVLIHSLFGLSLRMTDTFSQSRHSFFKKIPTSRPRSINDTSFVKINEKTDNAMLVR